MKTNVNYISYRSILASVVIFTGFSANAGVEIGEIGCYQVVGNVLKITNSSMTLTVYQGSMSETDLAIKIVGTAPVLFKGDRVRIAASALNTGPAETVSFESRGESIRLLRGNESPSNWKWISLGEHGKCI